MITQPDDFFAQGCGRCDRFATPDCSVQLWRQGLLALRALASRPLPKLTEITADPVGAWRREDPAVIAGLAALELRSAGVAPVTSAR